LWSCGGECPLADGEHRSILSLPVKKYPATAPPHPGWQ